MTDLAALAARTSSGPRWQECHMAWATRVLPDDTADTLARALANPHVTHVEITEALRGYGVKTTPQSVGRHRLGQCRCGAVT